MGVYAELPRVSPNDTSLVNGVVTNDAAPFHRRWNISAKLSRDIKEFWNEGINRTFHREKE